MRPLEDSTSTDPKIIAAAKVWASLQGELDKINEAIKALESQKPAIKDKMRECREVIYDLTEDPI